MKTTDSEVVGANVILFPTVIPPESALADAELDASLDAQRFEQGFDDASNHLDGLPVAWARHHANSVLADRHAADPDDPSYSRGYRAALYGFLRQTKRR